MNKKTSFTTMLTAKIVKFAPWVLITMVLVVAIIAIQDGMKVTPASVENTPEAVVTKAPKSTPDEELSAYIIPEATLAPTPAVEPTPQPTVEHTPEPTPVPTPERGYFDIPFDNDIQDFIIERMELMEIDLEPEYIYALIFCESCFTQSSESYSGASGYMQVMPATYKYMYPKMIEEYPELAELPDDIWDMYTNLSVGLYVLHNTGDSWGYETVNVDNLHKILTCYNRGIKGGKDFYEANGTWKSGYSKKVFRIAEQIKADGGIEVY